ncbi:uncharacterized protein [Spinacia oleracea]|uniref:Uncharacterized protein n=1 Tax=Spinacia oleracea TaxID=3562 RepID=A0A9R0I620_SPIOL|nr:uncharacterized protein LOC110783159 [Spinacia oleracea]
MEQHTENEAIQKRPAILVIGSPGVGKRTILSRLLSVDFEEGSDTSPEVLIQGWTIDTKYYSADVAIWMAHLHEGIPPSSLPDFKQFAAIVMVFDMSELSSLAALKKWVSHTDVQKSDILLCIGNKVDLVPGHPAHDEYKRRLQRLADPFAGSDVDSFEYGVFESEGSSLLGNDEPSCDIKSSCFEWCMERNIEYVEACASNAEFDKCLSINGDSQGVERLHGALSAHMWPGMVLKSGNRILAPTLPDKQESSDEESDYEAEYEVLSGGSAELWDDTEDSWVSAIPPNTSSDLKSVSDAEKAEPSASKSSECREKDEDVEVKEVEDYVSDDIDKGAHLELEDLEHLMSDIANMRSNSRLMPDFQRREMAAKLAMQMAALFGDCSGDEGVE